MSFDLKIVNGDLVLNNGDFQTVVDSEKLIQDILKVALTPCGSNSLQPWYGSFINRSLVGSVLGPSITVQIATSQLQNALENLMTLQKTQVKSFQTVTPDELINNVSDIYIYQGTNNPTLWTVQIKVISKGMRPITTAFTVSTI